MSIATKPFRMGPINLTRDLKLIIPFALQGDWAVTPRDDTDMRDGAEERLSTKAGEIADAIENELVARGELSIQDLPSDIVNVIGSSDDNDLPIHVTCKSEEQGKTLIEFLKAHPLMKNVEIVESRVIKDRQTRPDDSYRGK